MNDIERIIERAAEVLGGEDRAQDWVDHQSATLGGTPRQLAETPEGTKAVILHLNGISRHSLT